MPVLRIGIARLFKSRNRRIPLAKFVADFAKREPRRGKARRKIGRLPQEIGCSREVALELKITRKLVPAVGNQIAGGQEQSRWHLSEPIGGSLGGTRTSCQRAYIVTKCARKTS